MLLQNYLYDPFSSSEIHLVFAHIIASISIFASRIQVVFTVVIHHAKHYMVEVCSREYMFVHKMLLRLEQSI